MNDRQKEILEFIQACADEGEPPPTIRELMDVTGITSTSVVNHNLDALARDGHIKRLRDTSRGIRLTEKGQGPKVDKKPNEELAKLTRQLAETVKVHQVQIADLQAEMKRLRQLVKAPAALDEADWQVAIPQGEAKRSRVAEVAR